LGRYDVARSIWYHIELPAINNKINFEFISRGLKPIYHAPTSAKIVIIGQAPRFTCPKSKYKLCLYLSSWIMLLTRFT